MLEYAKFILAVDSSQAKGAARDLDALSQAADRTERSAGSMTGAFTALKGAMAALGAGAIVRSIVQQADTYSLVEGRLRLVTKSTAELRRVQGDLFDVAQTTRTEYQATAELYTRLARSTGDVVRQQSQLIDLTRLVNQSFQVSGASAQEAAGGVMQFGQALQSGVLQGDELRAIRENAPRLFDAIVQGIQKVDPALGLTKKNFKDLASEGQITTERIVSGLLSQKEVIEREFAQLPRTVGGALTQLKNEFFRGIGQSNTSPIVSAIDDLRQKVADPQFQRSLIDTATGIAELTAAMVKLATFGAEPFREFSAMGRNLGFIAANAVGSVAQLDKLEKEIEDVDRALNNSFLGKPIKYLGTSDEDLRKMRQGLEFGRSILLNGGRPAVVPAASNDGGGQSSNVLTSPAGGSKKLTEAQRLIGSMREELALSGELSRLDEVRISLANGYYGKVTAGQAQELKDLAAQLDFKEAMAVADQDALEKEEKRLELIKATRSPLEQFKADISELNELFREGYVDTDTYGRRVRQLQEDFEEATQVKETLGEARGLFSDTILDMESMAKRGAENIQDALADFLFRPFENGLKGMWQSFAATLQRMAAEAAAQQVVQGILNLGMSMLSGGLPGADGRVIGGPTPPPGFASGGLFGPGWAMVGENGPEMVKFNGSGRVYNNGETAAMRGGGGRPINVTNNFVIQSDNGRVPTATQEQVAAAAMRGLVKANRRNN